MAQHTSINQLTRIVGIGEKIHRIVHLSEQINLIALNAMLAARQAGSGIAGFSMVSRELRSFSQRLNEHMCELKLLIQAMTQHSAEYLRTCSLQNRLTQTSTITNRGFTILEATLSSSRKQVGSAAERVTQVRDRLLLMTLRAQQYGNMGMAIARSAKIEAAHSLGNTAILQHVADNIESAIADIQEILQELHADITTITL